MSNEPIGLSKPEVWKALEELPSFSFTSEQARSRDESRREDIAFGVRSFEDLEREVAQRFGLFDKSLPIRK